MSHLKSTKPNVLENVVQQNVVHISLFYSDFLMTSPLKSVGNVVGLFVFYESVPRSTFKSCGFRGNNKEKTEFIK